MTSRVVTSWMAAFGTAVAPRAEEMVVEMARNDAVDSLPPISHQLENEDNES